MEETGAQPPPWRWQQRWQQQQDCCSARGGGPAGCCPGGPCIPPGPPRGQQQRRQQQVRCPGAAAPPGPAPGGATCSFPRPALPSCQRPNRFGQIAICGSGQRRWCRRRRKRRRRWPCPPPRPRLFRFFQAEFSRCLFFLRPPCDLRSRYRAETGAGDGFWGLEPCRSAAGGRCRNP